MNRTTYNQTSVDNLSNIVNGYQKNIAGIVTRTLSDIVIPWHLRDKGISHNDLMMYIKDAVVASFNTYEGSSMGAVPHENDCWTLWALLFGPTRADNFSLHGVVGHRCVWISDTDIDLIGLNRTKNGFFYTARMCEWLVAVLPAQLLALSKDARIDICMYAGNALALPTLPEISNETKGKVSVEISRRMDQIYGPGAYGRFIAAVEERALAPESVDLSDIKGLIGE